MITKHPIKSTQSLSKLLKNPHTQKSTVTISLSMDKLSSGMLIVIFCLDNQRKLVRTIFLFKDYNQGCGKDLNLKKNIDCISIYCGYICSISI